MQPLSRDDFFAIQPPAPVWVPLPQLGEGKGVYVRAISAAERDAFENETSALGEQGDYERRLSNFSARYVTLCACNAEGVRLFQPGDAGQVGQKWASVLEPIFEAARLLNRMFQSQEERDALLKNSAPASPPAGSPTA